MSNISRRFLVSFALLLTVLTILGTSPASAGGPHPTTGVIEGTVTNANGNPATGAHVSLLDAQHHVVATTTSNQHGEFHFPHVVPGHYTVQAVGRHLTHGSAGVDVHAGHTATIHIVLH